MTSIDSGPAANAHAVRDPEHLNDAIRLISRSTWMLLSALTLCVAGIVAWGFFGRLSFHAEGQGVMLLDSSVVANVVARSGGSVAAIHASPGQKVSSGDLLVSVKLDEVAERLEQARVAQKAQRDEYDKYASTSRSDVAQRKQDLDQQVQSLQASLAEAAKSRAMLETIYNNSVSEQARGLVTRQETEQAYDRLSTLRKSVRQMEDQISTSKTKQIEFEDEVSRNLAGLQMKVIEADARYRDLEVQFEIGSSIRSPVAGTVSEITTQPNATVASGLKLAVVESGAGARNLMVHAYLPIDQGKRVAPGMPAEISPSSVDERIYGSIRGKVSKVSSLPMSRAGLLAELGDPALVDTMMAGGAPIEIEITLDRDPRTADGLRWSSFTTPPTAVTAGTTADAKIVVDRVPPIMLILPIVETWTHL